MALVTVQRSPTPSTTSSPCASVSPSRRPLRSLLSLRLRFASAGPAERHCARAAPLPRPGRSAAANPPRPHLKGELRGRAGVAAVALHAHPLTAPATPLWHAALWLEHFLSGMSQSCFAPPPLPCPSFAPLQGKDPETRSGAPLSAPLLVAPSRLCSPFLSGSAGRVPPRGHWLPCPCSVQLGLRRTAPRCCPWGSPRLPVGADGGPRRWGGSLCPPQGPEASGAGRCSATRAAWFPSSRPRAPCSGCP